MTGASAVLLAGYALAVPVTVYPPGFLRMWRRREPALFVAAEAGAALVTLGWALRGRPAGAVVNAAWLVGLAVAYAAEGRKRSRHEERP